MEFRVDIEHLNMAEIFFSGRGAFFENAGSSPYQTTVGEDLEYSNEFAKDLGDKYFVEIKGLNRKFQLFNINRKPQG